MGAKVFLEDNFQVSKIEWSMQKLECHPSWHQNARTVVMPCTQRLKTERQLQASDQRGSMPFCPMHQREGSNSPPVVAAQWGWRWGTVLVVYLAPKAPACLERPSHIQYPRLQEPIKRMGIPGSENRSALWATWSCLVWSSHQEGLLRLQIRGPSAHGLGASSTSSIPLWSTR